jgi:hypothetical protein
MRIGKERSMDAMKELVTFINFKSYLVWLVNLSILT